MVQCPWPVDTECFTTAWEGYAPEVQERSVLMASAVLQRLTGGRVSNCPITVRPCKPADCEAPYYGGLIPPYSSFRPHINMNGAWINSCRCGGPCECSVVCEVILPAPVGRVDAVKVDGVVVPETDYRVDGNRLVYTGAGDCAWPASQNLSSSDSELDTFSITYLNAHPVDAVGAYAVAILAMEFAKACNGGKCRLPTGVTSIIRQGVSMEFGSGAFPGGLTGIREVDAFIAVWNPSALQREAAVWSPDIPRPRVTY